jgi:hypothetical protein
MASSPVPFQLSGSLVLPPDTGQPAATVPFGGSGQFIHKQHSRLELTGSGTKVVDFGTIPATGAKGVLVEVEPSATAAPVELQLNGSVTGAVEVSPGGAFAIYNPVPVSGLTDLTVVHTTDVTVNIWLLA